MITSVASLDKKTGQSIEKDESHEFVEVWEDLVSIKELVLSLLICSITTLGGYFDRTK